MSAAVQQHDDAHRTLEALAAKLGMRVSQRWNGTPEEQAAYAREHADRLMMGHDSDIQIASRVRMLMRDELDHEAVVTAARDRICALTVEKTTLATACRTARADLLRHFGDTDPLVNPILAQLTAAIADAA